jgi:hypothetical protein
MGNNQEFFYFELHFIRIGDMEAKGWEYYFLKGIESDYRLKDLFFIKSFEKLQTCQRN